MKKIVLLVILSTSILFPLVAGEQLSVPIGHEVYSVLKSGEMRGIISDLPDVRPYSTSFILTHLNAMLHSEKVSAAEKQRLASLIGELTYSYEKPTDFSELALQGAYSTEWEEYGIGVALGVNSEISYAHSLTDNDLYDARNAVRAYLKAQFKDYASIYMDFGLRVDHLEPQLFLKNDFTIPTDGRYDTIPYFNLLYGLDMHPEIALSFLDDNLQFRWGSVERDWGVGTNNLMISGSARSFEGVETYVRFAPWLRYSFIAGSLGDFYTDAMDKDSPENTGFYDEYLFHDEKFENLHDNNFTAHRLELSLPWNINFGIYESVVYRKRFELGYLNPLGIILFQQISMGDFDNVLAGVDLEWNWPGVMRMYGAFATTEMHEINPLKFFDHPRNIMGLQGGADFNLPVGQFSSLTVQYTYLSPFFYTHYPWVNEELIIGYQPVYDDSDPAVIIGYEPEYGSVISHELMYINKGQNLGYPLRPSSDEILVKLDVGITELLRGDLTLKYQRRSGQYGFNFDTFMVYSSTGGYEERDFSAYIFEKTFGLNLGLTKKFKDYPVSIQGRYLYTMVLAQENLPTPVPGETGESDGIEQPIKYTTDSPWLDPQHTHAVQIGVSIWK